MENPNVGTLLRYVRWTDTNINQAARYIPCMQATFTPLPPMSGLVIGAGQGPHPPTDRGGINRPEEETFSKFFQSWVGEQERYLQQLLEVARDEALQEEGRVRDLVARVLSHYEHYYHVKGRSARQNVFAMFSPSWTSSLENTYLWVGGWRPNMAFHLLYSKFGLQVESRINDFLRGIASAADVGGLAPGQLAAFDRLQRDIIEEEQRITEMLAEEQEKLADMSMVALVDEITIREAARRDQHGRGDQRVESELRAKSDGLEEVLEAADHLRLKTLRGVVEVLSPSQAVLFLVAAAELHLRIHEWGKNRDASVSPGHVNPSN